MSIKITWKLAGKLLLTMVLSSIIATWLGLSQSFGVILCLIVIYAENRKPR